MNDVPNCLWSCNCVHVSRLFFWKCQLTNAKAFKLWVNLFLIPHKFWQKFLIKKILSPFVQRNKVYLDIFHQQDQFSQENVTCFLPFFHHFWLRTIPYFQQKSCIRSSLFQTILIFTKLHWLFWFQTVISNLARIVNFMGIVTNVF